MAELTIGFAHAAYRLRDEFLTRGQPMPSFEVRNIAELEQRVAEADSLVVSGLWRNELAERTEAATDPIDQCRHRSVLAGGAARTRRQARQPALIEALRSGEPLPASSPIWRLPNVLVTPHSAGETSHYESRIVDMLLENIARVAAGAALLNEVV